jgi:SAM-dependent methyltransferase
MKRLTAADDQPLSIAPARSRAAVIAEWIEPFGEDVRARVGRWLQDGDDAWVVTSHPVLERFRLAPRQAISLVEVAVADQSNHSNTGRMLWLVENRDNQGLDDFEAEAVFGSWLEIDLLAQHDRGGTVSRLIVAGTVRIEGLAVSFSLRRSVASRWAEWRALAALALSPMPIAVVFLEWDRAVASGAAWSRPTLWLLRALIRQGAALGLLVPRVATEAALEDLPAAVRSIAHLVRQPIRYVRFEVATALDPPDRVEATLIAAGLACDTSLTTPQLRPPSVRPARGDEAGTEEGRTRDADGTQDLTPYLSGGAYQPQRFDIRSGGSVFRDPGLIELITTPVTDRSFDDAWARRRPDPIARLVPLLELSRMEWYHQHGDESVALAQQYDRYRVYNWPKADPAVRLTLFDGGPIDAASRLGLWLGALKAFSARAVTAHRFLDGRELLELAQNQAREGAVDSASTAIKVQTDAHGYLATIPLDAPLRADHEKFAAFLPAGLGSVLEMGSGYGQLARRLSPRATRFVCLELNPSSLQWIGAGSPVRGVAGDAHRLPFVDHAFDSIVINNVLEHLYDPVTALCEMRRVLRPGGSLFALIPLDFRNSRHEVRTHRWKADEASIAAAIRAAGLRLERQEVVDLYALGVNGCFPTCDGLVAQVAATA